MTGTITMAKKDEGASAAVGAKVRVTPVAQPKTAGRIILLEDAAVEQEPYYNPSGNEIEIFEAAYRSKRPVALVGPTGTGKSTFARYMAWKLGREFKAAQKDEHAPFPYIQVGCHEDLSTPDLVGRYVAGEGWRKGPLYLFAEKGGVCLLDEIVEARHEVRSVLNIPASDERSLVVEKRGEVIYMPDHAILVVAYNPEYQASTKDLKPSQRQRFVTIPFEYPTVERETDIIVHQTGIDTGLAQTFAQLGAQIRQLRTSGQYNLQEGASTRLLIMAAELTKQGIEPFEAAKYSIVYPLTHKDAERKGLISILEASLG